MSLSNGGPPGNDGKYASVPTEEGDEKEIQQPQTILKDSETNADVVSEDAEIVVPPDGGWGWVIVAASFACNVVVDGIIFTFGMFLTEIATDLNVTKAHVSLVGSLMSGFYLMAGPFASALANRYGFRLVAITGSIIGSSAFVLSYFATSVEFLCISYGLLGAFLRIFYFSCDLMGRGYHTTNEINRKIESSSKIHEIKDELLVFNDILMFMLLGIGFGLIYVPAVIAVGFYFERWRALATGIGVCGSGIGGFLFGPLCIILIDKFKWRTTFLIQAAIILSCIGFGALFRPVKPTKIKDLKKEEKELEMDIQKLPTTTRSKMEKVLENMKTGSMSAVNNNSDYPTVADVYATIGAPQYQSVISQEKRLSVPFINKGDKPKGSTPLIVAAEKPHPILISNRRHTFSDKRVRTTSESSNSKSKTDINRPMYREDILLSSLVRLPQFQSRTSLAYNLSITHIPTNNDIDEEAESRCKLYPEAVKRTLATMLDFSLLQSPTFILLAISGALTMMGFYVPFMFLTDRAIVNGMDKGNAMFLIAAISIANTIGRVLCGLLSSLPGVNTLIINNTAISIGGIATLLSGLSVSDEYQFFYCAVFGLAISCFASLRSIIVVELLGLERLTNAFGLLLLFQGIAAAIGAPIAGAFMEATGSYDASFYLSGSLILASAVICYPLNYINTWEKQQNKENVSTPI